MTDRLTPNWTDTLEEAFGPTGLKGRQGELFALAIWQYWGYKTWDLESQKSKQISGRDIEIQKTGWKRSYSLDIKNNMDNRGGFFVNLYDKGWLFNPSKTSHRICHVNPEMYSICWYDRRQMQSLLLNQMTSTKTACVYVSSKSFPSVIQRRDLSFDEGFKKFYRADQIS